MYFPAKFWSHGEPAASLSNLVLVLTKKHYDAFLPVDTVE